MCHRQEVTTPGSAARSAGVEGTIEWASERLATDRPARQAGLRDHNLALVLREISAAPRPVSRALLASTIGLTRATVSSLVESLLAGGLVREVAPAPRVSAGRPATGLLLDGSGVVGLGLELAVDHLAACAVDLTGTVRHRTLVHDDQRSRTPQQALAALAEMGTEHVRWAIAQGVAIAGVTVAVPGLVDGPAGVLRFAPNLGWRDVPVIALLGDCGAGLDGPAGLAGLAGLTGLPIGVDNEANLAALGEAYTTPHDPGRSFLLVSGEIGVGAGIVINGQLFRGDHGWSGEIGHLTVDPAGPTCRCGARGCLEAYAGQEALLRAARLPIGKVTTRRGVSIEAADSVAALVSTAEQGRVRTVAALTRAGRALGLALAAAVNLLDLDEVVLGGIYAPLATWLRPAVQEQLRRRVLADAWAPVTVSVSALGTDAAMLGAARATGQAVLDDPAGWLRRSLPA